MAQVSSSPGVPKTLPAVAANSASPILTGPPLTVGITTNSNVFATGQTNVWPAVLIEQGVVVTSASSTPIVLPNKIQP